MNFDQLKKTHPDIVLSGELSNKPTVAVSLRDCVFNTSTITWVNQKNISQIENVTSGTVICPQAPSNPKKGVLYIQTSNPRSVFASVLEMLYPREESFSISDKASISKKTKLHEKISIGAFSVIEDDVQIGKGTRIGNNTVILRGTIIEENVLIGNNCVVGGVGFGYEKNESSEYTAIRHVGIVRIKNNAEIGNNTCIDRAVLGETLIGENVKIDNLVHVAHGVKIGRNSLVIANAMIGGSVEIGENCWIAPSSSIINGIKIGNNVVIGMGAVVLRDVADKAVIVGNPGKELPKKS